MATAKKEYRCLNAVLHNGERHTKTIKLTDAEAAPLLKSHAIAKHATNAEPDPDAEAAKKAAAEKAEADAKAKAETEEAEKKAADVKAKAEADAAKGAKK